MYWKKGNKYIKSLKDVPTMAIGFVYRLEVISEGRTFWYIGKKNLYSITNPTVSKKKYLEAKKKGIPVVRRKKRGGNGWNYKLKNVKKESNWKTYESSSKSIGKPSYKVVKKEILYFCNTESELKYREAKEIICSGALETEDCLNKGVSIRIFGDI